MIKKSMVVELDNGLEARPVAMLVQVACRYESSIMLNTDSKEVNAKSIMGLMALGLTSGEKIVVTAEGTDEQQAIDGIEKYLSKKSA